jgi:hypothetical protein
VSAPYQALEEQVHLLVTLLAAILNSLPDDHRWLDPGIEAGAKSAVKLYGKEEEE